MAAGAYDPIVIGKDKGFKVLAVGGYLFRTRQQGLAADQYGSSSAGASSASLVLAIQSLLARLGYDPGPINGEVGLRTNMAIAAFQKSVDAVKELVKAMASLV